ncbi:hypothetical protein QR680_011031 [Steinernema hermaphroditum]|uniref:G-protein coupled receptors family 1 profile domain-containing protein n=1 Tax=Steinernema hermaphroditum TaxID=289476 RepID=A0AA39IQV3_9BILA|nr:hypothetical protein QR680_011031 [Steinernema hermaphroditum]
MAHSHPFDPSHGFEMECHHATSLSTNPFILGDLVLKVLLSTVGLVLCITLFMRETELRKVLHFNARAIIMVHFLAVMVNALAQSITGAFDFLRFTVLTSSSQCDVSLLSHSYAIYINIPIILSQNMDSLTLVALGIERTVATVWAKSYEQKNYRFVSISLIVASSIVSIWWVVRFFSKVQSKHVDHNLYSMITVPSEVSGDSRLNTLVLALLEITIFIIFLVILGINLRLRRRARRVSAPLAMKYQVEENLASVTVLLPMAFVQVLIYGLTFILSYELGNTHDMDNDNESWLLFTNISPIYHVALPVIWFIQASQKRKTVTRQAQSRVDSLAQDETKTHFDILKDLFHDNKNRTRY